MPVFGRTFDPVRLVPAIDPAVARDQVLAQVKSAYPGAENIVVPVPALEYYVTEAGVPQGTMEPDLLFSGITLDIDGQTLALKDLSVPAVDTGPGGLGPTVTIDLPLTWLHPPGPGFRSIWRVRSRMELPLTAINGSWKMALYWRPLAY